ncbi:MAG TPA: hypothetical protein VN456_10600, partial [Desulfosporosinus sp.]|nr:hypothetical protein [Desulfosporosinus sp.]
ILGILSVVDSAVFDECYTIGVCHIRQSRGNPSAPGVFAVFLVRKVLRQTFNVSKFSDILSCDTLG